MLALRIGIAAICLMVSLPFLLPIHTAPIPSFQAEWIAAALGLAAGLALLDARRLPLSGTTLLAFALAAITEIQVLLGRAPVPQLSEMFALYLLWAALLSCAATHLAQAISLPKLTRALAAAVLIGSLLAALTAICQPLLKQAFGWIGFGPNLGGALGQRNHFADYLWLGLASALYLRITGALPRAAFWAAAALLTLTAALGGQRSSLLYAAALIAISFWQTRIWKDAAPATAARRLTLGIAALFLLMQPVAAVLPALTAYEGTPPPAMRAINEFVGPSIRVELAHLAVNGIATAPLTGNGIGSFPGLALAFADQIAPADNPGPAEHGHNILLDLAAELGLPAAVLVLLAGIAWTRGLPRQAQAAEAAWAMAVVAILALHSLIEYPLWHAYFLGLLAVVTGAFGRHRAVGRRLTPLALTLGLVTWGSILLASTGRDYSLLEDALRLGKRPASMEQARGALLSIGPDSLLTPWVNTTACVSLDPLLVAPRDGLAVCSVTTAFAPTIESSVNQAVLLWRAGKRDRAEDLMYRLARASRYDPGGIRRRLAPLMGRDATLNPLARSPELFN